MWIENSVWGTIKYKWLCFEKILKCNSNILTKKYSFIKLLLYLFIAILLVKITRLTSALERREDSVSIKKRPTQMLRLCGHSYNTWHSWGKRGSVAKCHRWEEGGCQSATWHFWSYILMFLLARCVNSNSNATSHGVCVGGGKYKALSDVGEVFLN